MRYRLAFMQLTAALLLVFQAPIHQAQAPGSHTESTNSSWDPLAPEVQLFLECDPSLAGSCYHTAQVALVPRTPPSFWGLRIDLESQTSLMEGGLNFGAALAANARGEAYAKFRIENPYREPQRLNIQVDAHFTRVDFPGRLGIEAQLYLLRADEPRLPVSDRLHSEPTATVDVHTLHMSTLLLPGEYLLAVNTVPGSAWATFEARIETQLAGRTGGGFSGSAEVGGYLTFDRNGLSLIGFAGFYIGKAQKVNFRTMRLEGIGGLILRVVEGEDRVIYDSRIATTTTTTLSTTTTTQINYSRPAIGYGNVNIIFEPNPVEDRGAGEHRYNYVIQETNGVEVNLSKLLIDGYEKNVDQWFGGRRLQPFEIAPPRGAIYRSSIPLSSPADSVWTISGSDNQGHSNLSWRGIVTMVPARSSPYANLKIDFKPNPAIPGSNGSRPFTISLSETNGAKVKLTKVSVNNVPLSNYAKLLGGDELAPKGALSSELAWPEMAAAGQVIWKFEGIDGNGHSNIIWQAQQDLVDYVPLLEGQWQSHEALDSGLMPFQYTAFVPADALSMCIEIEPEMPISRTEASTPGPLSVYVRAGIPVEDALDMGILIIADYKLTNISSGDLIISHPALTRNLIYYVAVGSSDRGYIVPYKIRATYKHDIVPTTIVTTSTILSTTTRKETTTTTTTVRATTTTVKTTTTTRPVATSTSTTARITTTTNSITTTTLASAWNFGASKTYDAPSAAGALLQDSVSGHAFRFPNGGGGKLTVTQILSGPDTAAADKAFKVQYTGSNQVQLVVGQAAQGAAFLEAFGSSDFIASMTVYPVPLGWHPFAPNQVRQEGLIFNLPLPGFRPSQLPAFTEAVGWEGVESYRVKKYGNEAKSLWDSIYNQIMDAAKKLAPALPERWQEYFKWSIEDSPPQLALREPCTTQRICNEYMPFLFYTWGYLKSHTIALHMRTTAAEVAHEFGHYAHNVLIGDSEYYYFYCNGSGEHNLGQPNRSFIEEPAYLAEYYLYGTIKDGKSPERGDWLAQWVENSNPNNTTIDQLNFPDLEGAPIAILASLVRREGVLRSNFARRPDVKVPVVEVSHVKSFFNDAFEIIGIDESKATTERFRSTMESWLDSRYNGQADKLPALLQAIGWNYRVQCKFTDSKGNAVQGVSAIPLIQAGGQEYQLVDGVSPKNSSQTETQDDGELLFSECFPGDKNKTVLRVKYQGTTQDIKDKINIPWSTPTNKVFSAKDIVVTDCIPFMPRNAKSWNYELMIYPQGKDCQGKDLRLHRLCVSFHDGKIDSGSGKTIGTCNQDPQEISGTYDNCTGKFSFTYKVADYWNYRGGNTIEWEGTVEGAWPKPGESTFCNAKVSGIQRRVCSDRNALGCDNKIFNCSDAFAGRAADYKYCPKTP